MCSDPVLKRYEEREGVLRVAGWVDAWGRMVGVHPGGGMLVARGTWSLQHGPPSREGGQANIHRLRDLTVRATSCPS